MALRMGLDRFELPHPEWNDPDGNAVTQVMEKSLVSQFGVDLSLPPRVVTPVDHKAVHLAPAVHNVSLGCERPRRVAGAPSRWYALRS